MLNLDTTMWGPTDGGVITKMVTPPPNGPPEFGLAEFRFMILASESSEVSLGPLATGP